MTRFIVTAGYIVAVILTVAGGLNAAFNFQQLQYAGQLENTSPNVVIANESTQASVAVLHDKVAYNYLSLLFGVSLFTVLTLGQLVFKQRRQLTLQAINKDLRSQVAQAQDLAQQLSYQTTHDELTGVLNRREFERRLQVALDAVRQRCSVSTNLAADYAYALCYLDLDNFKVINDTCDNAAGDELLKRFAKLLSQQIRKSDAIARLQGDEFAILIENCSLAQAQRAAEQIRSLGEQYRFPYGEKVFDLKVTIGLVVIDKASAELGDMLRLAERACQVAKERGRNRIHIWRCGDQEVNQKQQEVQWVGRINKAMQEERLHLYMQPIVPVQPDKGAGKHYELLLRMQDEDGRIISPAHFLPAAERYNLSTELDRWVIEQIMAWLQQNPHELAQLELCSINLSGRSLSDPSLMPFIQRCLWEAQIPARKICFEVTETAAIATLTQAIDLINDLKKIGCQFALDDFGTGFSSFAYLKNLPVDFLKIDGMFVKDMASKKVDYAMVKSISELGHVMGMKLIAEYVENRQVMHHLRQIGVDYAQGYYLGKPQWIESLSVTDVTVPLKLKKIA